jgi:hypothetical protein
MYPSESTKEVSKHLRLAIASTNPIMLQAIKDLY